MTKVSFTGTRQGMSIDQWKAFDSLILDIFKRTPGPHEWHDGMCIGADAQAHDTVIRLIEEHNLSVETHCHCKTGVSNRAKNLQYDIYHRAKAPLVRNKEMVLLTDLTIAAPFEMQEQHRGGTWSTVRYCHKVEQKLFMIWPDGSVDETKDI
jgi:hypothetical protein